MKHNLYFVRLGLYVHFDVIHDCHVFSKPKLKKMDLLSPWVPLPTRTKSYVQTRTVATWFRCLTDAGFMVRDFLEPQPEAIPDTADDPIRYYATAKAIFAQAFPG